MKARIKSTGELFEITDRCGVLLEEGIFPLHDVDFISDEPESFDWETFRNETAVKCLLKLLERSSLTEKDMHEAPIRAVILTLKLIDNLKK